MFLCISILSQHFLENNTDSDAECTIITAKYSKRALFKRPLGEFSICA